MDYMTAREASKKMGYHAEQSVSFMRSREDPQRRYIRKCLGHTKRCC